jgi:single-strand DNA-binding protein
MNKAILIGSLGADPELRTTNSGISKCNFRIAVQRSHSQNKEVDWINCVAWRGLADNVAKYTAKGRQVAVLGSIQTRTYDTASGEKRYVTEVVADEVQFLSKGGSGGELRGGYGEEQDSPLNTLEPDFEPLDEDSLPF